MAEEQTPTVSVIMPTYGNRGYLAESVQSVLAQTFTDFELLIIDDCSTVPIDLGTFDPRIRVIRHVRNQGPGAARNTALAHAQGHYVAFLDDDDLYPPDRLQRGVDEIGEALIHCVPITITGSKHDGDLREEVATTGGPFLQQVLLRRADCLQFDPTLRVGEDADWWLRMRDRAIFHWSDGEPVWFRESDDGRPGLDVNVRLRDREIIAFRHRHWMNRGERARRYDVLTFSALVAGRRMRAAQFATRSLLSRPSWRALRGLIRACSVGTSETLARHYRESSSKRSE